VAKLINSGSGKRVGRRAGSAGAQRRAGMKKLILRVSGEKNRGRRKRARRSARGPHQARSAAGRSLDM